MKSKKKIRFIKIQENKRKIREYFVCYCLIISAEFLDKTVQCNYKDDGGQVEKILKNVLGQIGRSLQAMNSCENIAQS